MFRKKSVWLYLLPGLVGLLAFYLVPFVWGIWFSLTDGTIDNRFVGFDNYLRVWQNEVFQLGLKNTIELSLLCAPVIFVLSFLLAGIVCFIYVVLIRKQKLIARQEAPKYAGAAFETAGQFAYIFALSDTAHVAISAPIISAYCVASVLWSRLFLKEKLSWKHYAMIALVVAGIVILGIYDE